MSEPSLYDIVGTNKPSRDSVNPAPPSYSAEVPMSTSDGQINAGVARRSWAEADGTFWGTPQSHERLPVGLYRMGVAQNLGPIFQRQKNDTDSLVPLPDSMMIRHEDQLRRSRSLYQHVVDELELARAANRGLLATLREMRVAARAARQEKR